MARRRSSGRNALLALAAFLLPLACGARTNLFDDGDIVAESADANVTDALGEEDDITGDGAFARDAASDASRSKHDSGPPLPSPRLVAPLSTAMVTTHSPVLRWVLASGDDGAQIDICSDRACTNKVMTFNVVGSSAIVPHALPRGFYFWRARGVAGDIVHFGNSAVWQFYVGVEDAPQSSSWGSVLDVNGDGFADVMVGAPNSSGDTENVYLYIGGLGGLASTPTSWGYTNQPNGYYRDPIASAGDIDGDGFDDAVIGVPNILAKSGAVNIYSGGPSGLSTATPTVVPAPTGIDPSFGWVVSGGGDINGDGYADVLIGASMGVGNGMFVYYGGPTGLDGSPDVFTSEPIPGGAAYFGNAVATAGDVNGDGYADVIAGSSGGHYVFLFLGSASGLSTTPARYATPHTPNQIDQNPMFGNSVACAGDVNADGFTDVIVGAPGDGDDYNRLGSVYLYFGSASGLVTPPYRLVNPTADVDSAFGAYVGPAGDVNGDGFADVLGATDHGSYLYLGGPTGPTAQALTLSIPDDGQNFVFGQGSLGAGWDVDGDGFDDLLSGGPDGNSTAGGAYLYLGSGAGPGAPITLVHPAVPNGFFGTAVAKAHFAWKRDHTG